MALAMSKKIKATETGTLIPKIPLEMKFCNKEFSPSIYIIPLDEALSKNKNYQPNFFCKGLETASLCNITEIVFILK